VDSSNYVYVVMGGGLYVYSVNSSGAPNPATALTGSPYAIGSPGSPSAMTISTGNNYLYVATAVSNLIYGFTGVSGNGTLTAMAPTSVAAPPGVAALGRDSDGTYLLAGGYSALSGLQLYTIGSAGLLKPGPSVVNPVSTVPMTIAFTH